jgi:hypothetical protein
MRDRPLEQRIFAPYDLLQTRVITDFHFAAKTSTAKLMAACLTFLLCLHYFELEHTIDSSARARSGDVSHKPMICSSFCAVICPCEGTAIQDVQFGFK